MVAQLDEDFAFLGAGIIAEVWMERLIFSEAVTSERIMACDVRAERLEELKQRLGVRTSAINGDGAGFARLVVVATPPSEVLPVVREVQAALGPEHIVVSLAAGVPLARLEEAASDVSVLRVMPNTPSLVGEGMNLVAYSSHVPPAHRARVERLLNLFGRWFEVADEEMELWCALCSVGPTYIFPTIEALASAAAARGIAADRALIATAQVVIGAARIFQQGRKTLPELKRMISLRTLREDEARKLFADAYNEAVNKLEGLARRLAA